MERAWTDGLKVHTEDVSQSGDSGADVYASPAGTAMRDAMWRGHGGWEIAFTPAILGFFGFALDQWIGTIPLFTIIGAVLGLFGSVTNQYYRYTASMERATAERLALQEASNPKNSRRFGRVEPPTDIDLDADLEPEVTS